MPNADFILYVHTSVRLATPCFRRAHIVSHDMGDSVLTEILARLQRGMLPDYFNGFFRSVTFTNGGMIYDLINKRVSQVNKVETTVLILRLRLSIMTLC